MQTCVEGSPSSLNDVASTTSQITSSDTVSTATIEDATDKNIDFLWHSDGIMSVIEGT